ncbi:MAG: RluA family pseudouridine synthase [Puniceicoccales bacterium]|jgi:23S rRNA pseudouridine1911/1915/1917 synthase|nr:RluA family pseudouridine synthase [Puniceicoccales bacterium]
MPTIILPEGILGERCDKILSQILPLSRANIRKSFEQHPFECNGKKIHLHEKVYTGDIITYEIIDDSTKKSSKGNPKLDIIFEDEDIIVINKPADIVVHPGINVHGKTLQECVLNHCALSPLGQEGRPGVVHRLDKDTTGAIIFAKSNRAFQHLTRGFARHAIKKCYTCIVQGTPMLNTGKIEIPIARQTNNKMRMIACPSGKSAKTIWTVHRRFKHFTWVDVKIHTGRTHQIRVHMSYIGHPIGGDLAYGYNDNFVFPRVMLHAESIAFSHPQTGEYLSFDIPLPQDFSNTLEKLCATEIEEKVIELL